MDTPEFRRACRTTHSFVDAAVQRALDAADGKKEQAAGEKQRYVFIDALVQQTREKKVLRDQCLNVLLAGRDTTACCLTWTMQVNTVATVRMVMLIVLIGDCWLAIRMYSPRSALRSSRSLV